VGPTRRPRSLKVLGGIVGERGVALHVEGFGASLVLSGISPASVGGDMSVEPELAEDPHDIRLIGRVGSIVRVPVSLTTDHVIIGTSNVVSVITPGLCTACRAGLKGYSHYNALCVVGMCCYSG
jgi:hypothetical protein